MIACPVYDLQAHQGLDSISDFARSRHVSQLFDALAVEEEIRMHLLRYQLVDTVGRVLCCLILPPFIDPGQSWNRLPNRFRFEGFSCSLELLFSVDRIGGAFMLKLKF